MSDLLRELLRSPLDDLPHPRRPRRRWLAAGFFGLATGAVAGLLPSVEGPTPSPSTVAAAPAAATRYPPGYVEVGPSLGLRVEWMYQTADAAFLAVSSAVRNDAAGGEWHLGETDLGATRRTVGLWTLTLSDGTRVAGSTEVFDESAPGVVTIRFDTGSIDLAEVARLELTLAAESGSRVLTTTLPVAIPADLTGLTESPLITERIEQTDGTVRRSGETRLVIDRLAVRRQAGVIEWHLEGDPTVRAFVEAVLDLTGPNGDLRGRLYSDSRRPTAYLQRHPSPVVPAAAGTMQLRRELGTTIESGDIESMTITWSVAWVRYTGGSSHSLDLTTATLLDPIGD